MDWLKQQLIKRFVSTIIGNSLIVALALLSSGTVALFRVSQMVPSLQSKLVAFHLDPQFSLPETDVSISPGCSDFIAKNESGAYMYYGRFTSTNPGPSDGFVYNLRLNFNLILPLQEDDVSKTAFNVRMFSPFHIRAYSSSGTALLDKHSKFESITSREEVMTAGQQSPMFTQVTMTALLSTGSKLLSNIRDLCIKFNWKEKTVHPIIVSSSRQSHIAAQFTLDCHQDIYSRLMCLQPLKLVVLFYIWLTLSVCLIVLTIATIVVVRIAKFIFIRTSGMVWAVDSVNHLFSRIKTDTCKAPSVVTAHGNGTSDSGTPVIITNPFEAVDTREKTQKAADNDDEFVRLVAALSDATRKAKEITSQGAIGNGEVKTNLSAIDGSIDECCNEQSDLLTTDDIVSHLRRRAANRHILDEND